LASAAFVLFVFLCAPPSARATGTEEGTMALRALAVLSTSLILGAGGIEGEGKAELGGQIDELRIDAYAPPTAPLSLKLLHGGDEVATTEAKPDGTFALEAEPGVYTLQVFSEDGKNLASVDVALESGSQSLNLSVPSEPLGEETRVAGKEPEEGAEQGLGGAGTAGTPEEDAAGADLQNPYWQQFVETWPEPLRDFGR
jgi:hypothetical protein